PPGYIGTTSTTCSTTSTTCSTGASAPVTGSTRCAFVEDFAHNGLQLAADVVIDWHPRSTVIHEDIQSGEWRFDLLGVEALLDASIHLAADRPLPARKRLDAGLDNHDRFAELIDTDDLDRLEHEGTELRILLDLGAHAPQDVGDPVGVFAVRHAHVEDVERELAGHVRHRRDRAVGKDVDGAVEAAQDGRAQIDLLDESTRSVDDDHVAHAQLVLHEHEESADDVAHEVLRAEAHGQADDARAGQNRRHVEADFAQDHDERDRPDGHADGAADDAGNRVGALFEFE